MIASRTVGSIEALRAKLQLAGSFVESGTVICVRGLVIEASGPALSIGDVCSIETRAGTHDLLAEVVGFADGKILLMPYGDIHSIGPNCRVYPARHQGGIPLPEYCLGRILDALGNPLDSKGPVRFDHNKLVRAAPPHALQRSMIKSVFETGVKAIDSFIPVGKGQRMGIFAGSGVGKSTLLGMLARNAEAAVNVIALVGERGREVREFVEEILGEEGLSKSVIVVSTSDQPALLRLRAAYMATSIAESFRDQGQDVLFIMDSVTRFAMAQREIGLSVGEPPASRGYPPSTFSLLPRLLERTGTADKGSITAFYTVLVEGDDMNEPIADTVRGILDGHMVLSRQLATANQFPAIDVLESVSRLNRAVCSDFELSLTAKARDMMAVYRRNEDLINIGAYQKNTNPEIDKAISKHPEMVGFIKQSVTEKFPRDSSFKLLQKILT